MRGGPVHYFHLPFASYIYRLKLNSDCCDANVI
nr:MAG TPA: DASH complex subunit Dam1 [Caudoviricetes sp.]